jgi:hypothetical protein
VEKKLLIIQIACISFLSKKKVAPLPLASMRLPVAQEQPGTTGTKNIFVTPTYQVGDQIANRQWGFPHPPSKRKPTKWNN